MEGEDELASRPIEIILLVHGIRTFAWWQPMVKRVLEGIPNVAVWECEYGYFNVFRFWCPFFTRRAPLEEVRAELEKAQTAISAYPDARLSVIAHSYGTYIITELLSSKLDLKLHRILLCGSIVRRRYPWHAVSNRIGAHPTIAGKKNVINDYGLQDVWPVLAKCLSWGYGDTGRHKFGKAEVTDRGHNLGHSDFFTQEAPQTDLEPGEGFVRKYWKPWFETGEEVRSPANERGQSPLWLSWLSVFPIQWLILAAIACALLVLSERTFDLSGKLHQFAYWSKPSPDARLESLPGNPPLNVQDEDAKFRSGFRRTDVIESIRSHFKDADFEALCRDFSYWGGRSMDDESLGLFVDHCIDTGQLLKLFVVLLDNTGVRGTTGDWPADTEDESLGPFPILSDGTFDLTGGAPRHVSLQVVFETTGERFKALLPEDIRCEIAAQRIITNIFFRDIPIERRSAYLAPGAHYHLIRRGEDEKLTGTLQQAGVKNEMEVRVATVAPMGGYPWSHDASMAANMLDSHFDSWIKERTYRLQQYASVYINKRLNRTTGNRLAGLLFKDPAFVVKPWDVGIFLEIVRSENPVPPVLLEYLREVLRSTSDEVEGDRASAAKAVARIGTRAVSLVPNLINGAADTDTEFAIACVLALGQMANESNDAIAELERLSRESPNQLTKLCAALMVLRNSDNAECRKVVAQVLDTDDVAFRLEAIELLGWELSPIVSPETSTSVEDMMIISRPSLSRLNDSQVGAPATQLQNDRINNNLAANIIVDHLTNALESSESSVRMEAAYTVAHYGKYASPAVPNLILLLEDKSVVTQPGILGDKDDRKTEVRESAVNALGRLGPVARDAAPALANIVLDRDEIYWMRNRAASSLRSIGSLEESETRKLEKYLNTDDDTLGVKKSVRELLDKMKEKKSPEDGVEP